MGEALVRPLQKEDVAMTEVDKARKTVADAPVQTPPQTTGKSLGDVRATADEAIAEGEARITEERAKAAELDERLDKLEKEVFPERPEPVHVDQAIGT